MIQSSPTILSLSHIHLVGCKGVAMASLAQCFVDAGLIVTGSDVAEDFVTKPLLDALAIEIQVGFERQVPANTQCVVYTGAHQGSRNAQVLAALEQGIPALSQAEALAQLANTKQAIAVCGVGGKSTVSAMLAWIFDHTDQNPSFAVGVGEILGMQRTGKWSESSKHFIVEADEYVDNPSDKQAGKPLRARFSYLTPWLTVCTSLRFDHPDVYDDLAHTVSTFQQFFGQIVQGGILLTNSDAEILQTAVKNSPTPITARTVTYGKSEHATWRILAIETRPGSTIVSLNFERATYSLTLAIPGEHNAYNAVAALAASYYAGISIERAIAALATFHSTKRRFELVGTKNGVTYYDDYAHHPDEVAATIAALKQWCPGKRIVVAFQSHTFSRTKALFSQFVEAFVHADEVAMIDIFPSAREAFDASVTSDGLCEAITAKYPHIRTHNYHTLPLLAEYLRSSLQPDAVCITLGAGDIYHVHTML